LIKDRFSLKSLKHSSKTNDSDQEEDTASTTTKEEAKQKEAPAEDFNPMEQLMT
jgi:hypothetical protein